MATDYATLSPADELGRAVDLIIAGHQQDFPVIEDGTVVGVLTRSDLLSALARSGQDGLVGDVMQRDFQLADAYEMLEVAFARLQSCQCHTLPVTREGRLVGLVTMENMGEFLSIQSALDSARVRA
jgi:CBS-domain-containing membrane protein